MKTSHIAPVLAACAFLSACNRQPAPLREGPPRLIGPDELTPAERLYGLAPEPGGAVVYQPDVVTLPAGADAIRSMDPNGLTWRLDPSAEGAEAIRPGRVLLLTNRAAGRVLTVDKSDDGLDVVLGPIEITEVIREGQFALEQAVDFDKALSFAAPDLFDPQVVVDPLVASAGVPGRDGVFIKPVRREQAAGHRFTLTPLVGSKGLGVRITSNGDGVRFLGQAVLYLNAPRLRFNLDIRDGRVVVCEVELTGAAGLFMSFEAASPSPTTANINERRYLPVDFSIPVAGLGVPFAVNVRQIFELKTAFTSSGALSARGYYTLQGGLRAGYRDGRFSLGGPTGLSTKETLLPSMTGAALGVTGMVMTHHVNVIVGVGFAGFAAGPYVFLNSAVTVTRGSSLGIVKCRQETLSMAMGAGVGYRIPQPVTDAINSVLRALNVREQLQGSGGFDTKPMMLVDKGWYWPAVKACG